MEQGIVSRDGLLTELITSFTEAAMRIRSPLRRDEFFVSVSSIHVKASSYVTQATQDETYLAEQTRLAEGYFAETRYPDYLNPIPAR